MDPSDKENKFFEELRELANKYKINLVHTPPKPVASDVVFIHLMDDPHIGAAFRGIRNEKDPNQRQKSILIAEQDDICRRIFELGQAELSNYFKDPIYIDVHPTELGEVEETLSYKKEQRANRNGPRHKKKVKNASFLLHQLTDRIKK